MEKLRGGMWLKTCRFLVEDFGRVLQCWARDRHRDTCPNATQVHNNRRTLLNEPDLPFAMLDRNYESESEHGKI